MKTKFVVITGPRKVEVGEEKVPEPGAGEVQVRSLYSGISHGTEMNVYRGDAPMWSMRFDGKTRLFVSSAETSFRYPLRYGYALVGEIAKVGPGVSKVKKGDVVYCEAPHGSGHVVKAEELIVLPRGLDPKLGVFLANLRTTFIGVLDAGLHLHDCVAVFGQGILGQFVVQWAKLSGARPVVALDLNDRRLRHSTETSGADVALNPKRTADVALEIRKLTNNRGADVVVEVSASDAALHEAIRTVCYNGKVVVLSWYPGALKNVFPGREFHHNRVQLICSQTGGIAPEFSNRWSHSRVTAAVLERMPEFHLAPLISHEVNVEDAAEAYRMIDEGREDVMQVVLKYT